MRTGLVGDDVDRSLPLEQLRKHVCGIRMQADREAAALVASGDGLREHVVDVVGEHIEVAVLDAAVDARAVDVDADGDAVVHGHGEGLRAAHSAEACGERDGAGERLAAEREGDGREGLEKVPCRMPCVPM